MEITFPKNLLEHICRAEILPMAYGKLDSYAPHAKRSPMAAFLYVEHVDLVLFCFAKALHSIPLGGPPGPLSPSGFAPIRLYLTRPDFPHFQKLLLYC